MAVSGRDIIIQPCHVVYGATTNSASRVCCFDVQLDAKPVDLFKNSFWTRVRFPPAPPFAGLPILGSPANILVERKEICN